MYPELQTGNAGGAFDGKVTVKLSAPDGSMVKTYSQTVSFAAGHGKAVMEKVNVGEITRWIWTTPACIPSRFL